MELVNGVSLRQYMKECGKYEEESARHVMRKLFSVLEYIHSFDIVYKLLEPERILIGSEVDDTCIKLISDIDVSSIYYEDPNSVESPYFIAPEILECRDCSKKTDMWSAGAILYFLLCGSPFCDTSSLSTQYDSILRAKYEFDLERWKDISHEAKHLISNLLLVDPNQRLSSTEALDHLWFKHPS
uniref:Protein kinase domain-containing protein n=1 Tax=Arcella intermedia TaxID=1963864 RepID=A0A6B2LJY1_9EUKA